MTEHVNARVAQAPRQDAGWRRGCGCPRLYAPPGNFSLTPSNRSDIHPSSPCQLPRDQPSLPTLYTRVGTPLNVQRRTKARRDTALDRKVLRDNYYYCYRIRVLHSRWTRVRASLRYSPLVEINDAATRRIENSAPREYQYRILAK